MIGRMMNSFFDCYTRARGYFDFHSLYADAVKYLNPGEIGVELGTFEGKSALYFGLEMQLQNSRGSFVTIDTFDSDTYKDDDLNNEARARWIKAHVQGDIGERLTPDQRFQWISSNIKEAGLPVTVLKEDSVKAADNYKDGSLGFVFLDSLHTYERVRDEIKAWMPKLKPRGLLAGHDYAAPGVYKAVNQFALGNRKIECRTWCWGKNV
jgi:predicted O-methyltransferase YrrM